MEYELMIKAWRRGWETAEIPSLERKRFHGHSHLSYLCHGWSIAQEVFRHALRRQSQFQQIVSKGGAQT